RGRAVAACAPAQGGTSARMAAPEFSVTRFAPAYIYPLMTTDRELLEQVATHGDQAAFAALVERHVHGVHGAARRQCAEEADDITQAVFLLLWQRAPHLRVDGSLAGWLHRATRYCCANDRRTLARRRRHEREAAMRRTN